MQGEMPATRVYSPVARALHWITVVAVFAMIPVGLAMSYRGNVLNIWDGLTNGLYSAHKLAGFLLLIVCASVIELPLVPSTLTIVYLSPTISTPIQPAVPASAMAAPPVYVSTLLPDDIVTFHLASPFA